MSVRTVVFTDLDGTLLNHHDYRYDEAMPAIETLRAAGIPLILVSSKTRPEMRDLCEALAISDPYVCENGSLMVFPAAWADSYGLDTTALRREGDEWLGTFGADRERILEVLAPLHRDFAFTGFADMTVSEVMHHTGLEAAPAARAMERSASEPLLWLGSDSEREDFAQQLRRHQLRLLKGGRFYHVMADCDKGDAVRYLLKHYQRFYQHHAAPRSGAAIRSIALGDSPNDLQMLRAVDQAVVMPHQDGTYMEDPALEGVIHAPFEGAKGWRVGVERALTTLTQEDDT